jgi:hypothetical protein
MGGGGGAYNTIIIKKRAAFYGVLFIVGRLDTGPTSSTFSKNNHSNRNIPQYLINIKKNFTFLTEFFKLIFN